MTFYVRFHLYTEFATQSQLGHGNNVLGNATIFPLVDVQLVEQFHIDKFPSKVHIVDAVLDPAIDYR